MTFFNIVYSEHLDGGTVIYNTIHVPFISFSQMGISNCMYNLLIFIKAITTYQGS